MKAQSLDSEAIRERAYHKWLQAGAPEGDGAAFWLAAENELAEERRNTSADPPGNRNVYGGITTSGAQPVPDKEQIVGTRG